MLSFKDQLVRNKYLSYQRGLEKSVSHIGYGKRWIQLSEIEHEQWNTFNTNGFQLCQQHQCHNVPMQYNSYYQSAYISYPFFSKINYLNYITYNTFKNDRRTNLSNHDRIKLKDEIWFNCHNSESVNITGDYIIKEGKNGVLVFSPKNTYSLKINDYPVKYIFGKLKNVNNFRKKCISMYFTFDPTAYCDIIDLVLKARSLRFKFLP